MVGIEVDYKCVKEVVVHRGRKENPFPSYRGQKDYLFEVGETYRVTKKELFDGSGVYTYLIKHPEKELFIAPLFLDSFFSKVEREEVKHEQTTSP